MMEMLGKILLVSLLFASLFLQNVTLVAAEETVSLHPVADNYADSKYPRSRYGYVSALYVGNSYDHAQDIWGSERIYIRFDLSDLTKGETVLHATLRLWQYYAPSTEQEYEAHRVLGGWSEDAQNWENQPRWASQKTATAIAPNHAEVAVEWDITSDVAAWYSGQAPNHGTMIKVATEAHLRDSSSGFWSREYPVEKWKPVLTILVRGNPALAYSIRIRAIGLPLGMTYDVLVDGRLYRQMPSNETMEITFDGGRSHTIEVGQIVQGPQGIRYACKNNMMNVSDESSLVFTYVTEYIVSFVTDPPDMFQVPPNGWYEAGASLVVNRTGPILIAAANATRLVFNGWYMNSKRIEETPGCTSCRKITPTLVLVDGTGTVEGRYRTEYYLNVTSPAMKTEGSGWYTKGSVASFSVDKTTVAAPGLLGVLGLKRSFVKWTGSSNFLGIPDAPHSAVIMNESTTIEAVWQDDWSAVAPVLVILLVALTSCIVIVVIRRKTQKSAH